MKRSVTFRLDPGTARILKELTRRNGSKSQAVRDALRARYESLQLAGNPTPWEVYSQLKIPKARPYRDTARHIEKLLKERLRAKRRDGTL
jgi:hypothetical protein